MWFTIESWQLKISRIIQNQVNDVEIIIKNMYILLEKTKELVG